MALTKASPKQQFNKLRFIYAHFVCVESSILGPIISEMCVMWLPQLGFIWLSWEFVDGWFVHKVYHLMTYSTSIDWILRLLLFFNKYVLNEMIINIKWWFVLHIDGWIDILVMFKSKYTIIFISIKCTVCDDYWWRWWRINMIGWICKPHAKFAH